MIYTVFAKAIDASRVIEDDSADTLYGAVTTGDKKRIAGALKPLNADEISRIIAVCRENRIKLYPISSGCNWGYSDSMPADHHHVILDLSLMDGITDYNVDTGVVTVGPGVTQKQLYEFLQAHGGHHVVSVTGSSPDASIIGNYLERGFGLLSVMDHALSVMALTAILGDGSKYVSPLQALGGHKSAQSFRWGLGPYTDGLFFQSSFGVVTSMTIKLSLKPESIGVCFVDVADRESLAQALKKLQNLRESWGLESLQTKILNSYYNLAGMGVKYDEIVKIGLNEACKKYDIPPYTVMITFSGDKVLTRVFAKYLKRTFSFCKRTRFFNDRLIRMAKTFKGMLTASLKVKISVLEGLWDLLQGKPGSMMIGKIPYYRILDDSHCGKINPAQDKCGIIWFALALPFQDQSISDFEELGAYAQSQYGFDPVINFTNYSQSGMVGLFAIVFNQETDSEKARQCYMDLLKKGQDFGYLPYRMPLFASEELFENMPDESISKRLKSLFDPDNIFPRRC